MTTGFDTAELKYWDGAHSLWVIIYIPMTTGFATADLKYWDAFHRAHNLWVIYYTRKEMELGLLSLYIRSVRRYDKA